MCHLFFVRIAILILALDQMAVNLSANDFGKWNANRVVFLGDSITHAGHFISIIETRLRQQSKNSVPTIINLGLPSETCSGLSEPDHPFPRPDVHERLARVLDKAKPDLVIVCYGMNDGIYHPFDEKRFEAYKSGINRLIDEVTAANAKLILMTPPPFDPEPLRRKGKLAAETAKKFAWFEIFEDYDAKVMSPYAAWIMNQGDRVSQVIDIRTPILKAVEAKRKTDPDFVLSDDGVHIDNQGHAILADAICDALQIPNDDELDQKLLALVEKKRAIMQLAWLTHVGHKRPGPNSKLSLDKAKSETAEIEKQISNWSAQK